MNPQELKSSILQLAIQGKLVEQRPEDGTAEELYRQIQAKRQQLIKSGKVKKSTSFLPIQEDDFSFDIPDNWKWVRICELGEIVGGGTPKTENAECWDNAEIPWLTPADMKSINGKYAERGERNISAIGLKKSSAKLMPKGTILYSSRAPIGYIAIAADDISTNQGFKSLIPTNMEISEFLYYALMARTTDIVSRASGTTFKEISGTEFSLTIIPLPPLAEQKRIVAKIEELLPYIDCYGQAWSKLEDFNKHFPNDMQKSILQMAIQGKLVEHRPEEGTGEDLFKQIQVIKQRLTDEGSIKKEKPLPDIAEEEKPFDIPNSWKWVRLIDAVRSIGDIDHKMPLAAEIGGYPYISPLDFTVNGIDFVHAKRICKEDFEHLSKKCKPERDDIIFPRYGTIGVIRKVETDQDFLVSYSCCTIKNMKNVMDVNYIYYVLNSGLIKQEINRYINKTTQPNIGLTSIKRFLFPLPPLAEQRRIVSKLEETLPLCEKLK